MFTGLLTKRVLVEYFKSCHAFPKLSFLIEKLNGFLDKPQLAKATAIETQVLM